MAMLELVMDKCCSSDEFFTHWPFLRNDTGKTGNFISCRKMAIFELVMDKCCSSDEFFTHLTLLAMVLERLIISSFAVKWLYSTSHG